MPRSILFQVLDMVMIAFAESGRSQRVSKLYHSLTKQRKQLSTQVATCSSMAALFELLLSRRACVMINICAGVCLCIQWKEMYDAKQRSNHLSLIIVPRPPLAVFFTIMKSCEGRPGYEATFYYHFQY